MNISTQQNTLSYKDVRVKLCKMELRQNYFANALGVSSSAISQALRGKKGTGKLLFRIDKRADAIQRKRESNAARKLRSINNKYERRHTHTEQQTSAL